MAFAVHITDSDRAYLTGLPLSQTAKERVEDFIEFDIAQVDDAFRNDPANRTYPDTGYFRMDLLLLDVWGDGKCHRIEFIVDDGPAPFGILAVVYVDHQQRP